MEVESKLDKEIIEQFFNDDGHISGFGLEVLLPYESEFIIRYMGGQSKGCFNRIYISSKSRSIMIASAVTTTAQPGI